MQTDTHPTRARARAHTHTHTHNQEKGETEHLEEDEELLRKSVTVATEFVAAFKTAALQISL